MYKYIKNVEITDDGVKVFVCFLVVTTIRRVW